MNLFYTNTVAVTCIVYNMVMCNITACIVCAVHYVNPIYTDVYVIIPPMCTYDVAYTIRHVILQGPRYCRNTLYVLLTCMVIVLWMFCSTCYISYDKERYPTPGCYIGLYQCYSVAVKRACKPIYTTGSTLTWP